ncbi:MAG: hypothetical protein SGI84_10255 [Gemmatimonadota bacterium]|nr:hypothetical protein [Gemmatimonadota bacterium]
MTTGFRDIAVIGGGCYGTFYAGQLAEARDRGRLTYRQVLVVDRDPDCQAVRELEPREDRELVIAEWDEFLDTFFTAPTDPTDLDDAIVPSPLMPHLMAGWLERVARRTWPGRAVSQQPLPAVVGTPYESSGPDGTRYLSFADWICPVHCIEPLTCPVIRGPRTWELSDTLVTFVRQQELAGPAIFLCRHQAFGVGMFLATEARDGRRALETAGRSGGVVQFVIGTVSRCHGAVSVLHLDPLGSEGTAA